MSHLGKTLLCITGSWGYLSVSPSTGWSPLVCMTDLFPHQMTGKLLRTLKLRRFIVIPPIQLLALYDSNKLPISLIFCEEFVSMSDLCRMCKPRSGHKRELIRFKIQEAREKGHTDCLKVLYQIKDYWSVREPSPDKALVEAARNGQFGLVKYLVSLNSFSPLHGALREPINEARSRGHFHIVDFLVASEENVCRKTPLISATNDEDENMVRYLLQAGVDVNMMTRYDQTALEEATLNGFTNIAIMLIEAGADVNFLGNSGYTALMLAMLKRNLRLGEVLIKAGADVDQLCLRGHTALSHCALDGDEEGVRMLVEAGADVNRVNESGDTALMVAVQKGYLKDSSKGARMSAEAGADVNRPFLQAEQYLHSVLVEGTDLSRVGKSGDALMIAAQKAYVNIIEILIEAGANVNKICDKNKVALLLAFKGNKKGLRLLLRSGAKVNMGRHSFSTLKPNIRLLLYAAGEMMMNHPEYLKSPTNTLHHHCRMAIRRHLLKLDRHENLFVRIPRLGLPSRLTKYLLFDTSLDENDT